MDERVGDRPRLGDPGDAAARQVRRDVADVGRRCWRQVDDAHAVRADQRQAVLAGDRRDLALHRGGRLAALDHAAAGDDHGRARRRRRRLGSPIAARNGLSATIATSGALGQRGEDG